MHEKGIRFVLDKNNRIKERNKKMAQAINEDLLNKQKIESNRIEFKKCWSSVSNTMVYYR